jgi:two-component system cell cycle sensor histidine kinase/response regulator CckA
MKRKGTNHIRFMDKMVLIGTGLGALFWILESVIDVYVFRRGTFLSELFFPDPNELWMRFLVVSMLIVFGIYAQVLIRQRERAERAMGESEVWLSATLNSIGDAVTATDANGCVTFMNPVAQSLTRWDQEKAVGNPLEDVFNIINGETRKALENPVTKAIREGMVVGLVNNTILITKDGKEIPIDYSSAPIRNEEGDIIGVILVFRDVSERRRAEQALHQSEERYRRITEAVTDYIFTVRIEDGHPVETVHSPACVAVTGYTPEDFAADPHLWLRMVHEEDRGAVQDRIAQVLLGQAVQPLEHRISRKGGLMRWVRNTLVPNYDSHGKLLSYDGLISDIDERKRAEETLRESEELFRNVYDTAPLAFVVWGRDIRVTDWNKKAEEVFGWSKEEALGRNFLDFLILEKDRHQVENVVGRLLQGELPSHSINDNLTKDGQVITCEWNNSALHDDGGNIVGAMSLALDMTERRRAQEALCENEATLKSIFRAAPAGIGMLSNRILKRVNDRICEMTGYSREELVEQSARMLYPTDEDFEYVGREKYAQIRERGTGTVETRWKRKDGKILDVLLSSAPVDPSDLTAGVTFSALDITERKKAEKELRESEDRYRRITEAITDYIYTVTVKDGLPVETIHGPACVAVTGYTAEHFKENPYLWIQMVHEEDREAVGEQAARTLSGERAPALEHRIIRQDGATRWVRNTPVLNFDSHGRLLSYDGLVQDVTERKQAEEAVRQANDELERFNVELEQRVQERTEELRHKNRQLVQAEKLAALGKMANRVAHELRNPLTVVGGFARRINEKAPADDPNKKYLQMIVDKVITMESKVSEITKFQAQ